MRNFQSFLAGTSHDEDNELMNRREFLKLSALSTTGLIAAEWLFDTPLALAATPEIRSSKGVLQATLVVEESMISYEGQKRWAMTYNGVFPAPTLRAKPGDELRITVVNKLKEPTNLHTHGLHTSPNGNGDNPFLMVNPGESFSYSIKVRKDQLSGTFWYHPHHHHLAAKQVSSGLAGALIVEDKLDSVSVLTKATERVVVLSDPRIGQDSSITETTQSDMMHGRTGPNTLVNGLLNPTFRASGSKAERWRIVNACASEYQNISVRDGDIYQISSDSSRLPRIRKVAGVSLTPGQRTEILIVAKKSGVASLRNSLQEIAKISYATPSVKVSTVPLLPFKRITKADKERFIRVVGGGGGMGGGGMGGGGMGGGGMGGGGMGGESAFTFDGKPFDAERIDQFVKFGTTEDWVISNPSNMAHPFHIHAWPFQVVNDGTGRSLNAWHDTVNLPARSTVTIRIPFVGVKGKTVYHCHILDHEDMGMMGTVLVE
jgi:FtsP/CotA-like multicopper oxidase with cupredoxin domain